MKRLLTVLAILFCLVTPAASQFNPGCGGGFCGLSTSSGGGSVFNGGKSQIQFWLMGYAADHPFINEFKFGQGWSYKTGGFGVDPNELSSDGYPLAGISNGGACQFFYVATESLTVNNYYFITWAGTASSPLTLSGASVITGSLSTSGVKVQPTGGGIQLCIQAGTVISDLKFYSEKYSTNVAAGEIWSPDFLDRMRYYNGGVVRFLDWQAGNSTNVSLWAHRRPITYAYYAAPELRASLYQGSTTYALNGSSNDYAINLGAALPTDKQTIIVKFNANSAGATNTFSIDNGVTKYPMLRPYADALTSSARWPSLNRKGTLVFDAQLQGWLKYGGDTQDFDWYLDNGVPFELMIDLCVKLGAHPYFVTPYLSVSTMKDWHAGAAAYIRDNGPSWMIPRFEGINEDWNNSAAFYGTAYSNAKQLVANGGNVPLASAITYPVTNLAWTGSGASGTSTLTVTGSLPPIGARISLNGTWGNATAFTNSVVYVTSTNSGAGTITVDLAPTSGTNPQAVSGTLTPATQDYHNFYGQIISDVGQAVSTVYSNNRARYEVYAGVQTGAGTSAGSMANSDPRLTSRNYVLRGGSAAFNWVTAIVDAQYIAPSERGTNQELVDGYAYTVTNAGNPSAQSALAEAYVDTLNSGSGSFNVPAVAVYYANWKGWALPFGVTKMHGYEGGYSPDFSSSDVTSAITGATRANPCVLTLPTTNIQGLATNSNSTTPAAVVGMQLTISGIVGMTQLNGNTYTVTAVSGQSVTINVDASAFTAYTSGGTATYVSAPLYLNTLRNAGRFASNLGTYTTLNYNNFVSAGGAFPSQYVFSSPAGSSNGAGAVGTGGVWGLTSTVYSTIPSAGIAIHTFNQ